MDSVTQNMRNMVGYCEHGPSGWILTQEGSLAGQRLAVKDLFAVEGYINVAGSPDWPSTHSAAQANAAVIDKLMAAGTEFTGFTHTDELAYSLEGNNEHFGKMENPKLPGHSCGGSSMGSASAVASQWADIGLGTDTGGSIRVPACYCGLFGFRPSHGEISVEGLIGLAPRFDTVGWFTRSPELLHTVAKVLLPPQPVHLSTDLVYDPSLFELVEPSLQSEIERALRKVSRSFDSSTSVSLGFESVYSELEEVFRVLQGRAIVNYHGAWLEQFTPRLSAAVQARIEMAYRITDQEVRDAEFVRESFKTTLLSALDGNKTLYLPTTPMTAPKLGADTSDIRPRLLKLTAIAGLSGSPQVHLPLMPQRQEQKVSKPYGFSLLQTPGSDLGLLSLAKSVTESWNRGFNL